MNLALTVLQTVAPVFLLGAVGFTWVRLGLDYPVAFVTRLTMTLSVPCLIFVALMRTEIDPQALATLTLASLAAYLLAAAGALALARLARLELRTYLPPLIFGNTGNVGLPLALFAFGETGLGYAVVVFAVMAVLSFTFGVWMVSGGGSLRPALKEPMVGATLLGALFLWRGWQTPEVLTNTLDLAGQMAIPLMLMTLGVTVARLEVRGLGRALALSAAKLALCAGAAALAGIGFGLTPVPFAVLVMQVSTPVAVTSYFLAEKYGADAASVAGLVVASTVLAVPAFPVLLAALM